jgi:hypothetical protein
MPLGAAAIATYRDREWQHAYRYMSNCNLVGVNVKQVTIAGVAVRIRCEVGNGLESLHSKSIRTAVTDVVGAGHALPALDFYLTAGQNVPNVAMKTYTPAGASAPVIFLGPKMWTHNPAVAGSAAAVAGGLGSHGERGVANQAYDGTARFFGNPKQKAQGATIVIHELGHILHEIHNPGVFWEELRAIEAAVAVSPNGPGWMNQSTHVSHYATKNQLEFVAEVFAGRLMGTHYALAVGAVYNALGGP